MLLFYLAVSLLDHFVHTPRPQRRSHGIGNGLRGDDVADSNVFGLLIVLQTVSLISRAHVDSNLQKRGRFAHKDRRVCTLRKKPSSKMMYSNESS